MIDPSKITNQNLSENIKLKIQSGHGKMIDPPIITDQNLSENFNFKIQPGCGKIGESPYLLTRISVKILTLRFSLDMER